jgi:hypothetical protein
VSFELPGAGSGDARGWDRASIALGSKKPYRPDVGAEDLLLPNEAGRLGTLWRCAVSALRVTALYVFVPLLILNLFVPLGPWLGVALVVCLPVLTIVLYRFSSHETRRLRRLAREL